MNFDTTLTLNLAEFDQTSPTSFQQNAIPQKKKEEPKKKQTVEINEEKVNKYRALNVPLERRLPLAPELQRVTGVLEHLRPVHVQPRRVEAPQEPAPRCNVKPKDAAKRLPTGNGFGDRSRPPSTDQLFILKRRCDPFLPRSR